MKKSFLALIICSAGLLLPAGSCYRRNSDADTDTQTETKGSKKSGCGTCRSGCHEHRRCCGK